MVSMSYDQILSMIEKEKGLSKEEIESRIKDKLNQLSDLISKEGAAHIIANELGVKLYDASSRTIKVKDLNPMLKGFEIAGKVLRLYEIREYNTGMRKGRVANMFIGDETGSCRITLWDENQIQEIADGKVKEGDIVKISNGYVKENRGFMELQLGSQGSWEINPKGIQIEAKGLGEVDGVKKDIKDIKENENVKLVGTVVQIFEPRFYDSCPDCKKKLSYGEEGFECATHGKVESKAQPILNVFFDDGTDNVRIVCFGDNVNKVLDIEDATVLKDNPDKFKEVQRNIGGKQLEIIGKVTNNTFFNRLEVVANAVRDANPQELAMELKEKKEA
tara:strand:+ start:5027 stop:6025 length:999 start_codon:yes stop_codon:yes gene_type:complete